MATPQGPHAPARAEGTEPSGTGIAGPEPRVTEPRPSLRRRIVFTPEMLEDIRRRYEQTRDTVVAIAADSGVSESTMRRVVQEQGWVRHPQAPLALPRATQLLHDIEALHRQRLERGPLPEDAVFLDNFLGIAQAELAGIKALRASMQTRAHTPYSAAQMAHTLASVTESVERIRAMRVAPPASDLARTTADVPFDEDDRYANIDAFRDEIARRIEAFIDAEISAKNAGRDP